MKSSGIARHVLVALVTAVALIGMSPRSVSAQQAGQVRYELTPTGNEARYRVREQLANVSFPSDAVGVTSAVTGAIVLDRSGKVVPAGSKIVVDITGLKSDQSRRDGYIQRATLQTAQFPKVELAVNELRGFKYPLPASGEMKFELLGDLTIHGVTKPSIWQVTATPKDGVLSGIATTALKFADFGLEKPRVMMVLTVEDDIRLEYTFQLAPKS